MTQQRSYWDGLAAHPLDASVIDPNDRLGRKNRYLAGIRDSLIVDALKSADAKGTVLDLGCGTGSLSAALTAAGWRVLGLDISSGLLQRTTERSLGPGALFAHYDGLRFPVHDDSVDAITTYVVLNHVLDDSHLTAILSECFRALKPGGRMACIEQVRKKPHLDTAGWKNQRTLEMFTEAFSGAGFTLRRTEIVRYGHFPTTPLVRAGLMPHVVFPWLARAERAWGRLRGIAARDYCDILFVLEKPMAT